MNTDCCECGCPKTIAALSEALRTIAFEERLDKRSLQLVARVALLKVAVPA